MEMNFAKLPRADPCELTNEWIFTYKDKPNPVDEVKKDKHKAPYEITSGGGRNTLEYFMQNTRFWKPAINSFEDSDPGRQRGIGVEGWQPVELEWSLDPRIMERVLAEYGEFIGTVFYALPERRALSVEIGRYLGNYEYTDSGSVLAYVRPKFNISVYPRAIYGPDKVTFVEDRFADGTAQTALGIGRLDNFLPSTNATVRFIDALRSGSGQESVFAKNVERLKEVIRSPDSELISVDTK